MHAHIDWTAQDCDGTLSGSHAMLMTEEEQTSPVGDMEFQDRVLASVVNVGARQGRLMVEEAEDGTPALIWDESTEEGGRSVTASFYRTGEYCGSDHVATRRDHTAEAAGY